MASDGAVGTEFNDERVPEGRRGQSSFFRRPFGTKLHDRSASSRFVAGYYPESLCDLLPGGSWSVGDSQESSCLRRRIRPAVTSAGLPANSF